MKKSLWQKDSSHNNFGQISQNLYTDILIIGGGITGITSAYNLIGKNKKVLLVEGNDFFNNTTCKSTGKITYLQDLKYQEIYDIYGFDTAKLYYESQKDAIRIIKKIVKENDIDCDLKKTSCITYTNDDKEISKFDKEQKILDNLKVKYYTPSNLLKDKEIKRSIMVKDTYTFNPCKYLKGLLKIIKKSGNVEVYQNSKVTRIKREKNNYIVVVNDCIVNTKKIILACNYPFFTIPGFIPIKTYMEKSYITATKVSKIEDICGITSNYPVTSFRYYEDKKDKYFIYLNNSSKICDKLNYKKNYDECIGESENITGKQPNYKWTNMDVMTNDYLPLVGRISEEDKNIFIATGYNTWGMTNGTIAAKIVCDLILFNRSKYKEIFNPSRQMNIPKFKNFINNTLIGSVKAYTFNLIKKNPSWYKGKAVVTKIEGKRVGIYFDNEGNKHIVSNICPHLKCFLTFNEVDKTWDCPCHGSRFDIDGNAVKGPSCYDIKIDETK